MIKHCVLCNISINKINTTVEGKVDLLHGEYYILEEEEVDEVGGPHEFPPSMHKHQSP